VIPLHSTRHWVLDSRLHGNDNKGGENDNNVTFPTYPHLRVSALSVPLRFQELAAPLDRQNVVQHRAGRLRWRIDAEEFRHGWCQT
jgi:hypothetical protein